MTAMKSFFNSSFLDLSRLERALVQTQRMAKSRQTKGAENAERLEAKRGPFAP